MKRARTHRSHQSEPVQRESKLDFALEAMGAIEWDLDLRTNIVSRSQRHDAAFGYAIFQIRWGYERFLEHVHVNDRARVDRLFRDAMSGKCDYDVEFRIVWPNDSIHWIWSKARFSYDAAGTAVRAFGIFVDVTERRRTEGLIRLGSLAIESTTDGIVVADAREPDYPIVYVNGPFERLTGYASAELIGNNCRILQGDDRDQPELADVRSALEAGTATHVTLRNYRRDGTLFWNELKLSPIRNEAGVLTHYVGVQTDVTSGKALEASLLYQATHDPVTGLPNRRLLEERLESALRDADRTGSLVAVAFVDLDRLKRVNDSFGHHSGDELLAAMALRMSASIGPSDTLARLGGDEFVIVMPDLDDAAGVEASLATVREAIGAPYLLRGVDISPSASIGVALYPRDAAGSFELVRAADAAMYAAKAERNALRFYDSLTMRRTNDQLETEDALRRALAHGDFELDYQPIYSARTGRIDSVEALLRWRKNGVIVPPLSFVPFAEESGLIVPIGEWTLRETCRQLREWQQRGIAIVPVALNISIAQLRRSGLASTFRKILADAELPARFIVLELTESIVMDHGGQVHDVLRELRECGFALAIDDFGTGFSSLSYLKMLPIDILKIDKSFVEDVATDRRAAAICKAIVTLAHAVGVTAVAEGVETLAQAKALSAMQCDGFQGYYFSRPARPAATERLLRQEAKPPPKRPRIKRSRMTPRGPASRSSRP